MICNVCGGSKFVDVNERARVRCTDCGSLERTRVIKLLLDKQNLLRPGQRVMHIAPERGLSNAIQRVVGPNYESFNLESGAYNLKNVQSIDLGIDCERLPSARYDVVIHSHVVEHIPSNITAFLFHLHRSLCKDGVHIMCFPIMNGSYEESLATMPDAERIKRFGQDDHVRRFGAADIHKTLGMIFRLPHEYDLTAHASPSELDHANIPRSVWYGFTSSSVFAFQKSDLKLQEA